MSANPEESQMCGYLKLRSGRGGKWRSSWWVLKDNVMFRFNAAEDIVAQETLPVPGWRLETLSDVSFNKLQIQCTLSRKKEEISIS